MTDLIKFDLMRNSKSINTSDQLEEIKTKSHANIRACLHAPIKNTELSPLRRLYCETKNFGKFSCETPLYDLPNLRLGNTDSAVLSFFTVLWFYEGCRIWKTGSKHRYFSSESELSNLYEIYHFSRNFR